MRVITIILTTFYLFLGVSPVFAVTVTISNIPSTITDQPFNIDIAVSGAQANTTNYLRANLFSTGTTKYFGFTFNGSTFVNSSDYSEYLPINIDSSGSWTDTMQAKLDSDSSYYSGPGNYSLKVRRYTQSGSSYTWSNEMSLMVDLPTPTPSPTPIPTPTPTPSPSPTPKPSATPTPTPKPKKSSIPNPISTPSLKPSPTYSPTVIPAPTKSTFNQAAVAGVSKSATSTSSSASSPSANTKVVSQKQINPFILVGIIFIIGGVGSLGYIFLRKNETVIKYLRRRN